MSGVNSEKSKFVYAALQNITIIFEDLQLPSSILCSAQACKTCKKIHDLAPVDREDMFARVLFDPDHIDDGRYMYRTERIIQVSNHI